MVKMGVVDKANMVVRSLFITNRLLLLAPDLMVALGDVIIGRLNS